MLYDLSKNYLSLSMLSLSPLREGVRISILKTLKHPNVVELKEVIFKGQILYLVFEYVRYDLKKFLKSKTGHLSEEEVKWLVF